jgi:hypothetical protein
MPSTCVQFEKQYLRALSDYSPDMTFLKMEIIEKQSYGFLALHSSLMPFSTVCSLKISSRALDERFLKGEIIEKRDKTMLWFFGTVLCLNALYDCVSFKQIMSKGY